MPAAGLSLEGGRRQCAELPAVGRRQWQHAHCTLVRPVARPSLRPAHRRLPMWVGYSVRPTQIYETTQQFIIMAIGWSVTWSLGASAKKVTEENIPPSTFGNRIAETITVHTTATHHPQSNKTSCATQPVYLSQSTLERDPLGRSSHRTATGHHTLSTSALPCTITAGACSSADTQAAGEDLHIPGRP